MDIIEQFIEIIHTINAQRQDGPNRFGPSSTAVAMQIERQRREHDLEPGTERYNEGYDVQNFCIGSGEVSKEIIQAVAAVRRRCPNWHIWSLYHLRGLSQTDIAKICQISQQAVSRRIKKADKAIKDILRASLSQT